MSPAAPVQAQGGAGDGLPLPLPAAAARCPLPLMILTGCVADRDLRLPILFIAAGWPCV
jgi:hypothetical protein